MGTISSNGHSFRTMAWIALLISYIDALHIVTFSFLTVQKNHALLRVTKLPENGLCGHICRSNIFPTGYTGSKGSSVTPCTVTGTSWQCVVQYCKLNIMILDVKCTAPSCNHRHGIPQTIEYYLNWVTNIGNCSLWSCIFMPTLPISVISPDCMGLPSMTSTCLLSFYSCGGIRW